MKIGKYIHELLLENETVIIPSFGAFISNYKPAAVNKDTDELKPPSKTITFNEQIRNNDGLLVGHIADVEQISHFDALKRIEKERENIIYQLDKSESVELELTGILAVDESGKIQFQSFEDKNMPLDSFGLEALLITPGVELNTPEEGEPIEEPAMEPIVEPLTDHIEQVTDSEKVEALSEPEPEPKTESPAPVTETIYTDVEQSTDQNVEKSEPAPLIIEEGTEDNPSTETTEQENSNQDKILSETENEEENILIPPITRNEKKESEPILKNEPIPVSELKTEPKEKKKLAWFWYILILVPIIIAGFFIGRKNLSNEKPSVEIQKNNELLPAPDSLSGISVETNTANDSIQSAKDTSKTGSQLNSNIEENMQESPKFYLIGGSFKNEQNAENYLQQLKSQGYESFHLGKRGNFYSVGIGKYDSEREAINAKKEFQANNPGSDIWIKEE